MYSEICKMFEILKEIFQTIQKAMEIMLGSWKLAPSQS